MKVIEIEAGIWFHGTEFYLTQEVRGAKGYETLERALAALKRSGVAKRVKLPEIPALRRTRERWRRGETHDVEEIEEVALVGHHANGNMRIRTFIKGKHAGKSSITQNTSWGSELEWYVRDPEVERLVGEIRAVKVEKERLEKALKRYEIEVEQYCGREGITGAVEAWTQTIVGFLAQLKKLKLKVPEELQDFKVPRTKED